MVAHAVQAGAGDAQGQTQLRLLEAQAERLSVQGKFEECLAVAQQMLDQATQCGDEIFVALAHWQFGFVNNLLGNIEDAESHFSKILTWQTPERRAEVRATIGSDFAITVQVFSAFDQWLLGYPVTALARSRQALREAGEQHDPYGQAVAYSIGVTLLFLLRHEGATLQEYTSSCHRLCLEHGYAMWRTYVEVFLGWNTVMRREATGGIEQMQHAISRWQALGMAAGTDVLAVVLADGCLTAAMHCPTHDSVKRNQFLAAGLTAVAGVLEASQAPWGMSYKAELLRLHGELLLARDGAGSYAEALGCFHQALALAHAKGALAWELRAAMSLVRLYKQKGAGSAAELEHAYQELRALYAQFGEGFDIPDLLDAAALLEGSP
jgi:tetratricopeptide (TPR) repeat protein